MGRGLEEVPEQGDVEDWAAQELATELLVRCCLTDGKFNNFFVALLTAIRFLNERLGEMGEQATRDLVAVLKNPATADGIDQWMAANYPE
ncbi:MAG: hypothetical protein ACRC33_06240 [Gemmataceae bacterium]